MHRDCRAAGLLHPDFHQRQYFLFRYRTDCELSKRSGWQ